MVKMKKQISQSNMAMAALVVSISLSSDKLTFVADTALLPTKERSSTTFTLSKFLSSMIDNQ